MTDKRAIFIGRWQPPHKGHEWLIRRKLDKGIPVTVFVRDIPPDMNNPYSTAETIFMLRLLFAGEDVVVKSLGSDCESVNWGRGVGYEVNEHPAAPFQISGTEIRNLLAEGKDVSHLINPVVAEFLRRDL